MCAGAHERERSKASIRTKTEMRSISGAAAHERPELTLEPDAPECTKPGSLAGLLLQSLARRNSGTARVTAIQGRAQHAVHKGPPAAEHYCLRSRALSEVCSVGLIARRLSAPHSTFDWGSPLKLVLPAVLYDAPLHGAVMAHGMTGPHHSRRPIDLRGGIGIGSLRPVARPRGHDVPGQQSTRIKRIATRRRLGNLTRSLAACEGGADRRACCTSLRN